MITLTCFLCILVTEDVDQDRLRRGEFVFLWLCSNSGLIDLDMTDNEDEKVE